MKVVVESFGLSVSNDDFFKAVNRAVISDLQRQGWQVPPDGMELEFKPWGQELGEGSRNIDTNLVTVHHSRFRPSDEAEIQFLAGVVNSISRIGRKCVLSPHDTL